jgi:hypothetical protein
LLVNGPDGMAIWNLLPVLLVFPVVFAARWIRMPQGGVGAPVTAFSLATLTVVVLTHLEWYFDWGHAQTGSSTAGLAFVFIPIGAIGLGCSSFVVAVLVLALRTRRHAATGSPALCRRAAPHTVSGRCVEMDGGD